MSEPRQATGTPIRELFDNADRIAALETSVERIYFILGLAAQTQMLQQQQIRRLEQELAKTRRPGILDRVIGSDVLP